ncbi:methyltransferase domain-containing protein [Donghicola sp. XS_ASV15]|uniref:class I SAM-dependent methyltransferase n=1 Tax=Donghicola sp. XS_ASV15 TaxID=3241295 RepID=UPI003515A62A
MEKIFLNLGSGPRSALPKDAPEFYGWREVRVDINPMANPDKVASLTDMKGVIEDNFADFVFCSHAVEHFYAHEVHSVLAETVRVLKPEGVAVFRTPDLEQVMRLIDPEDLEKPIYSSPAGDITALDILYGHRASIEDGDQFMAHKSGFTEEYFAKLLLDAGFSEVRTEKGSSIDFWAQAGFKRLAMQHQVAALKASL